MDTYVRRRLPLLFLPLFLLIFSLIPYAGLQAEGYELLRPDTGGHLSTVGALCTTPGGRYLLSAGRDKSLRVWDLQEKKQERLIPGVIGGNGYGYLYDMFLSRSGKYLITTGLFGTPFSSGYNFRCIDFETGKTVFAYGTGLQHLQRYAINKEDTRLAAGFSDGTLMLFDFRKMVAAGKHKALLHYTASKPFLFFDHPDREAASFPPSIQIDTTSAGSVRSGAGSAGSAGFLAVGFFDAAPGFVCAVTADAAVRLYDTKTGKLADELQFPDISAAAFSGSRLAVVHRDAGSGSRLTILKPTGKGELREADSVSVGEAYTGAVFSPEGNRLFLYAAGSGEIIGLGTGAAPAGGTSEPSSAAAIVSLPYKITAACWTGPEELALAGSESYGIHGHDPFSKRETFMLAGEAAPVWSVAVRDKEIAFGRSSYRYINEQTPLEQVFDLKDFSLRELDSPEGFRRIGTRYEDLEISWEKHPEKGEIIVLSRNGDPIRHISRGRQIGASVWCYGITEDGFVLTGGYSGALHISWIEREYSDGGVPEGISWRHDAPLTALAASPELIATAGKDGIIRLYTCKELYGELEKNYRRSKGASVRSTARIAPAVSMIITPEGEYCLWTPDGYYTCSEGGSGLLYRQKNLREGITPEIYALGEYKPENNRPDIIRERLGIGE